MCVMNIYTFYPLIKKLGFTLEISPETFLIFVIVCNGYIQITDVKLCKNDSVRLKRPARSHFVPTHAQEVYC